MFPIFKIRQVASTCVHCLVFNTVTRSVSAERPGPRWDQLTQSGWAVPAAGQALWAPAGRGLVLIFSAAPALSTQYVLGGQTDTVVPR